MHYVVELNQKLDLQQSFSKYKANEGRTSDPRQVFFFFTCIAGRVVI